MKPATVVILAGAIALGAVHCGRSAPAETFTQKLVILGYDAIDPVLTERWMA